MRDLVGGCVVILGGGTGVPFFTTDTASATRSVELACDMMVKCTNVDAVYDKDPKQYPDATKYEKVSYDEVLTKNLRVMDQTSVAFARDHSLPVAVCHIDSIGQLISFDPDSFSGTLMK